MKKILLISLLLLFVAKLSADTHIANEIKGQNYSIIANIYLIKATNRQAVTDYLYANHVEFCKPALRLVFTDKDGYEWVKTYRTIDLIPYMSTKPKASVLTETAENIWWIYYEQEGNRGYIMRR